MTGVYCWLNKVNGKRYVGSAAKGLEKRRRDYALNLPRGTCHNPYLQRAWLKYGAAAFAWVVIEYCPPGKCLERETYWIGFYKSADRDRGYNICLTGKNHLGTTLTAEHKAKIGAANAIALRGKKQSAETNAKRSASLAGRTVSAEHRAKLVLNRLGKKHSPETLAKLRTAALNRRPG